MEQGSKKKFKAFVGHHRGVATSLDGEKFTNDWVDILEVGSQETIKAVRFEMDKVGSGYMPVIGSSDVDALVARVLHVLDAANSNQALKDLVKEKLWGWFDEKVIEVTQ